MSHLQHEINKRLFLKGLVFFLVGIPLILSLGYFYYEWITAYLTQIAHPYFGPGTPSTSLWIAIIIGIVLTPFASVILSWCWQLEAIRYTIVVIVRRGGGRIE